MEHLKRKQKRVKYLAVDLVPKTLLRIFSFNICITYTYSCGHNSIRFRLPRIHGVHQDFSSLFFSFWQNVGSSIPTRTPPQKFQSLRHEQKYIRMHIEENKEYANRRVRVHGPKQCDIGLRGVLETQRADLKASFPDAFLFFREHDGKRTFIETEQDGRENENKSVYGRNVR